MPTNEVVAAFAKAESGATGEGPVPDGTAAVAQSLRDKHNNLAARVNEIKNKSTKEITKKHAAELESKQDRVLGTGARTPGGLAAEIQRQADHNDVKKMENRPRD